MKDLIILKMFVQASSKYQLYITEQTIVQACPAICIIYTSFMQRRWALFSVCTAASDLPEPQVTCTSRTNILVYFYFLFVTLEKKKTT